MLTTDSGLYALYVALHLLYACLLPPLLQSIQRLPHWYCTFGFRKILFLQIFEKYIKMGNYVDLANDQALVKYHYFWYCQS